MDRSVFREYDIRGIWQKNIDEGFSFKLGKAFGIYLKQKGFLKKRVSVGYDARLSSAEIFKAVAIGLNSEGIEVLDLGLIPTPISYFSLFQLDIDGSIMITASHNPKQYNGFKLSAGKDTLFGAQILEIADIMENITQTLDDSELDIEKVDILKYYRDYLAKQFGYLKDFAYKPRFAIDGGNGSAGFVGYDVFKDLGFEPIGLFIQPDGNFPNHHPDPTVEENLLDLKKAIKNNNLDFGIGYDGDGDRIGVVLRDGSILWGDQLLLLFAEYILKEKKDAVFVADVKCSDVIFKRIEQLGGKIVMYKTGHSLIKSKMKQLKADLAGEMSGHIFFAHRYFGYDDAIYVSLRLVEIATKFKLDLLDWKKNLPEVFNTPEIRIDCPEDKKQSVIERFKKILSSEELFDIENIIDIDGVRFHTKQGWGLVRASNTQPVLVLRFEAQSKDALDDLEEKTLKIIGELINE
ncbi:phosphomannomutase/phosphoglucomutase [Hippea jasoniae]|uniref:phosphomannomutase/phosphoglucomutase n=1 Tax=Hippea jasoniae TaxID=944479 RepID=UPI0005532052|nr:phosphomannomutase/phosphoglucomutase [Hippea jasoniae]